MKKNKKISTKEILFFVLVIGFFFIINLFKSLHVNQFDAHDRTTWDFSFERMFTSDNLIYSLLELVLFCLICGVIYLIYRFLRSHFGGSISTNHRK